MTNPLGFEAFRDYLAAELGKDLSDVGPQHDLAAAELDSLQRFEVLVAIEDLGVELGENSIHSQQTFGGLHEHYTQSLFARSRPA